MLDYDKLMMSSDDYERSLVNKQGWASTTDPNARLEFNKMNEALRSNYGYSGGANGSTFTSLGNYTPQAPSMGTYESDYQDEIDAALSKFTSRESFSYDPKTDESYQSFLKTVNKNAETTFNDTIAGASVGTGGRPNSWSTTIASKAMGDILSSGASEMVNFKQQAYNMYQQEGQLELEQLQALMGVDEVAYRRFVDSYNAEASRYNSILTQRQQTLSEAMNRTEMTGYVSNSDSLIIGVPAGTLSQEAQQRAWNMEDYFSKASAKTIETPQYEAMSQDTVEDNLIKQFGISDGRLKATPTEIGAYLEKLYYSGAIGSAELASYARNLGAEFKNGYPAQINDTTQTNDTSGNKTGRVILSKEKYDMLENWFIKTSDSVFAGKVNKAIANGELTFAEYEEYLFKKEKEAEENPNLWGAERK